MKQTRKPRQLGLKARSTHRHNPLRAYVPKDLDGTYRVNERLDGLSVDQVWTLAAERKHGNPAEPIEAPVSLEAQITEDEVTEANTANTANAEYFTGRG